MGTLDRPGMSRVLASLTSSNSTPTLPTVNSKMFRAAGQRWPHRGNRRRSACGRWVTSVADLRNNARRRGPVPACGAPRRGHRRSALLPLHGRQPRCCRQICGATLPGPERSWADDPSPKIGRHRAGRPCDRETIPTSFVETAVNQVIGTGPQRARPGARRQPSRRHQAGSGIVEPFLHDPHRSAVAGDQCGESRGAAGVVAGRAAFRLTDSLDQPRAARVTRRRVDALVFP